MLLNNLVDLLLVREGTLTGSSSSSLSTSSSSYSLEIVVVLVVVLVLDELLAFLRCVIATGVLLRRFFIVDVELLFDVVIFSLTFNSLVLSRIFDETVGKLTA